MAVDQGSQTGIILTTSLAAFISGWLFGLFTTRGYIISPDLAEERRRNLHDPVESDESEIDEDDTVLDHAPNWANGEAADRKQGLRAKARVGGVIERKTLNDDSSEECKLVLVVRTDLGMTKGSWLLLHMHAAC
jgi:PTH2 family peptidyl-tRNA hydrolase